MLKFREHTPLAPHIILKNGKDQRHHWLDALLFGNVGEEY